MVDRKKEVIETVFKKCPVCKSGEVEFVRKKMLLVFRKQEITCNRCDARFKYEGKEEDEDVYSLDLSKSEEKSEYDGQSLKRHEWERGLSDFDYCVKTNKLPFATIKGLNIILDENETSHWYSAATLSEERAVRESYGGAVRVIKGVYVGGSRGESHGELRKIDSGGLLLTNKRLVFNGDLRSGEFQLNKIISVEEYQDAIEIGSSNRKKLQIFLVDEPHKWATFVKMAVQKSKK